VPALIRVAGLDAKVAVAMSMGIIFPTTLASTAIYAALGELELPLAFSTAVGSFAGSYVSSRYILPRIGSSSVRKLFTTYMFAVGFYYLWVYLVSTWSMDSFSASGRVTPELEFPAPSCSASLCASLGSSRRARSPRLLSSLNPCRREAAGGTPFDSDSCVLPQRAPEARRHLQVSLLLAFT